MPQNNTIGKYFVGQKFNHWTLLEIPHNTRHKVLCKCDCGKECRGKFEHIKSGASIQCRSCRAKITGLKHGESINGKRTRLNSIWNGIIHRCTNKNSQYSHIYYDRGIRICDEWRSDYIAFRDWALSHGYSDELTIDRIDNNKGYEPSNCRWVTSGIQSRNKRNIIPRNAFGESKILSDWAIDYRCVVKPDTFRHRIRLGWDIERALTIPTKITKRWQKDDEHMQKALDD